jgi:outer membrane lipoprotein
VIRRAAGRTPARPVAALPRFHRCVFGFYDPAVYAADRDLTVVGRLVPPVKREIGEYRYRYPVVRADAVYLWPEPEYDPVDRGGVSFGWYYRDHHDYWGGPYW